MLSTPISRQGITLPWEKSGQLKFCRELCGKRREDIFYELVFSNGLIFICVPDFSYQIYVCVGRKQTQWSMVMKIRMSAFLLDQTLNYVSLLFHTWSRIKV